LRWRTETFASLLAVGLDPKKSNIFFQSQVVQHTELMWLLSTIASAGYLSRMTQWKTKLDLSEDTSMGETKSTKKLKLGLFSYPVLQAADILLYDATHVPIGADQTQHLEFTRNLARSFNSQYGRVNNPFIEPKAIFSPAKRIMSLTDPAKKMSKSDPDANSRILITDKAEVIHAKITAAVTDSEDGISYNVETRPGISNLLDILSHCSSKGLSPTELAEGCQNLSKKAFKALVADSVVTCLAGIRERYESILANPQIITAAAQRGTAAARLAARVKANRVGEMMGLGPSSYLVGKSTRGGSSWDVKDEVQSTS
jgi:tryptophanyl-tRNA synthetase